MSRLLRVISKLIRQVLPFDDAFIAVLNEAGDAYYELLTVDELPSPVTHQYRLLGYNTGWLPLDEPVSQAVFRGFNGQFPAISPSTINQRLADESAAKFLVAGSPWEPFLHRLQEAGSPLIHKYREE